MYQVDQLACYICKSCFLLCLQYSCLCCSHGESLHSADLSGDELALKVSSWCQPGMWHTPALWARTSDAAWR